MISNHCLINQSINQSSCVCVCVNEAVTGSATAAAIHGDRLGLEANEGVDRQRHRVGNWKLYGWEFHALLPNELGLMSDNNNNNNNNSNSNNRCNRKTAAKSETHRWNDPSRKQMRGAARMRHGLAPPTLIEMAQPAITTPIIIISRDGNKFPITICTAAAAVIIKKSFFLIKITNWEDWTVKLIDPARKFASTLTAWIINWPILGRWGGYVSRNPRPHPLITSDETPAKLKSDPIFKKKKIQLNQRQIHRIDVRMGIESAGIGMMAKETRRKSAMNQSCAQSGKYSQASGVEVLPAGQFSR